MYMLDVLFGFEGVLARVRIYVQPQLCIYTLWHGGEASISIQPYFKRCRGEAVGVREKTLI